MKVSRSTRIWLYGTFSILFVTGLAWFCLHRQSVGLDRSGADWHVSLQPWLLKIHGAAAMAFLVVFGVLIPTHIKKGIAAQRKLFSGFAVIGIMAALTVTGYALYYAGGVNMRAVASGIHTFIGVASPGLLALHVLYAPIKRRRKH